MCFRGWETSPKLLPAGAGIGHRVAIIVYRLPFDWAAIRMPITRPVNSFQTRGLRLRRSSLPLPSLALSPFIRCAIGKICNDHCRRFFAQIFAISNKRNISLWLEIRLELFNFGWGHEKGPTAEQKVLQNLQYANYFLTQ